MADTGNPWFIPFAEPSDLVRDWPALSSAVGTAVAAGLSAAGGLVQVQYASSSTGVTTTSTSFVTTGLAVTITPSDETHDILIFAAAPVQTTRTATGSAGEGRVRLTDGSATLSRFEITSGHLGTSALRIHRVGVTLMALVSPNSTSPQTYTLQMNTAGVGDSAMQYCPAADDLGTIVALEVKV
jgi:hypothetical protein